MDKPFQRKGSESNSHVGREFEAWARKILFVLRDISSKRKETLAEYYVRTNPHLIPDKVEVWEYDTALQTARQVAIPGR